MTMTRQFLLTPIAACLFAGFATSVHAQFMDEVEWKQEGKDAIAVIEFISPIQYTRSISARASDLVQAFYTVLPTREVINLDASERRLVGNADLPSIIVRDETDIGKTKADTHRRLIVRFGKPLRFKVRMGPDDHTIEIVLFDLGDAVATAPVKSTKPFEHAPAVVPAPATPEDTSTDAQAATLLAVAQSAFDGGNYDAATASINPLLNLPPNKSSRRAHELAGLARLNAGDRARAAQEFELFLKLYPDGQDSDAVRQLLASLPPVGQHPVQDTFPSVAGITSVTSGSLSSIYYGGKSDTRTLMENYIDNGIPVPRSDTTLSNTDQKQVQTHVDLNWRFRDTEKDMRFVFRDAFTDDILNNSKSRERLTALYFDYKSLQLGGNLRIGRQSPTGGGVLYRFDGIQAGYVFKPKWKVNAVVGKPTDYLLDTRRSFYGASVDAQALTQELSGSAYLIEQVIDSETDRSAWGGDLRYFKGGLTASGQLDYDRVLHALNIASVQSTWQMSEATSFNTLLDRRTTPVLSLGNALFFPDPALTVQAQRIQELLGTTPIDTLRERVKTLNAYQTQFRAGGTHTLTANWQTGADFSLSSTDAIPGVPSLGILPQASTGNRWGVSTQLIGTNLYSGRDTHVFNVSLMGGPTDHGTLLSYNNLSSLGEQWQLEPSVKYYTQSSTTSGDSNTKTVGIRGIYRLRHQISLESELTYEKNDTTGVTTTNILGATIPGIVTSATRTNYYLGARYEF